MQYQPPQFPERALQSKAVLYRPLQDIDVFVEDEGCEVFYTELLNRLVGDKIRIETVIPLRGRINVVQKAESYSDSRLALFLIDGDLHWVAGLALPSLPHLYIHPCYCIENYLFCEKAMIQIIVENSGDLTTDEAQKLLDWDSLRKHLQDNLVPLFVEFAVAFRLCPEIKTVSRGIGCILSNARKSIPQAIDSNKVNAVKVEIQKEILSKVAKIDYKSVKGDVESHISIIENPIDIVSSKDFLLPILNLKVNRIGRQNVKRKSFIFRLARHCSLERLETLRGKFMELIDAQDSIESTA